MDTGIFASLWSIKSAAGLAIVAVLLLSPLSSRASQIIVFGDSLSDTGNVFHVTGGYFPPLPYFAGRFSNGPLWIERFAPLLSVPTPFPSTLGGTDYAYAGAATGPTPLSRQLGTPAGMSPLTTVLGQVIANVPSLSTQVATYIASLKGEKPAPDTLAVVWAGANDFFGGQTDPTVPARNIAEAVAVLIKAGVKNFLIPNMPDLSKTPYALCGPAAMQHLLHTLSIGFNKALKADLRPLARESGVHIRTLDAFKLFQQVQKNPAWFKVSNVTNEGMLSQNLPPSSYLFWDGVHAAAAGHEIIATQAAVAVGALEPSILALLASGLIGLLGYGWRRRNAA